MKPLLMNTAWFSFRVVVSDEITRMERIELKITNYRVFLDLD
jgi:hypothetical protein